MRIEELSPNLTVTLIVNVNNEQMYFDTTILEVYPQKHLVLAEAIYRDEKIVTFRGANILINLLVTIGDNKPEVFTNVTITLVKKGDGSLCYNLETIAESKTYNRRENFRCYLGTRATFQVGSSKTAHVGILRDVSASGFAVVTDEKVSIACGQLMQADLKDYFEDTAEKFALRLNGIIVRIQELKNGSILYGCRLNRAMPKLEAYIMKKERRRLKHSNGGNL